MGLDLGSEFGINTMRHGSMLGVLLYWGGGGYLGPGTGTMYMLPDYGC